MPPPPRTLTRFDLPSGSGQLAVATPSLRPQRQGLQLGLRGGPQPTEGRLQPRGTWGGGPAKPCPDSGFLPRGDREKGLAVVRHRVCACHTGQGIDSQGVVSLPPQSERCSQGNIE